MKTIIVARAGNLSVADHLAEMQAWLAERNIVPRELVMLHVLHLRVMFRAVFDHDIDCVQPEEIERLSVGALRLGVNRDQAGTWRKRPGASPVLCRAIDHRSLVGGPGCTY